jgi:hypothetical protein
MYIIITILFFLFFWGSMGFVHYYQCPQEIIPDKDKKGFVAFHVAGAIIATFGLFNLLTDLYDLEYRFGNKDWQRILFVICLSFICFFVLGLLIEGFLILVEPKYRKWRLAKPE